MGSAILPRLMTRLFHGVVCCGNPDGVYLTFDDGPDLDVTPRLLILLDHLNCPATFFVSGAQVERHPDVVRDALNAGHVIASHGFSHRSLLFAGEKTIRYELTHSREVIHQATGKQPELFRPPYGRFGQDLPELAAESGMTVVLWSLSPGDYRPAPASRIIHRLLGRVEPGDIILLHDRGRGTGRMLDWLPDIIAGLLDKALEPKPLTKSACRVTSHKPPVR